MQNPVHVSVKCFMDMIDTLRSIGRELVSGIRGMDTRADAHSSMGRGVGGDYTFAVDKRAEDIIIGGLSATGAPMTVISEEAGTVELNGGGGMIALVDPIDGSKNAISGIPYYGTSIAVANGPSLDDIQFAYVLNLVSGEEFYATRGAGSAFMNGVPCAVQADETMRLVAYEAPSPDRDLPIISPLLGAARRTRCLGALALDLAYVASGGMSVFVTPMRSRSVDFAAGWLIVREAGGIVTDMKNNDIGHVALGLERSVSVMASANRGLHDRALEILGA